MQIEIDSSSGFCFGVKRAIELAEESLKSGEPLYCLGEIVHNNEEVKRLEAKGLHIIQHSDLQNISSSMIIVRAHGEPPSTFQNIQTNKNYLKDGTCPIVLHLQKKVKKAWDEMKIQGGYVVIYGKKGHAEVTGLSGQTNNEAIVISGLEDIQKLDFSKPVVLFAQTTMDRDSYTSISKEIRIGMEKVYGTEHIPFYVHNTICGHVSNRGEKLKDFADSHDVIVFVSGLNSSNGKVLFGICKETNPNSYWVQDESLIDKDWFKNDSNVGICGATSTPLWLMEKIADHIRDIVI